MEFSANFKCLDSKIKSFLFIFFILNIFSFILESINYFEARKLLESLNEFLVLLKNYLE